MSTHPEPRLTSAALAQLIATATLALCTLIVATAISIGFAHAAGSSATAVNALMTGIYAGR